MYKTVLIQYKVRISKCIYMKLFINVLIYSKILLNDYCVPSTRDSKINKIVLVYKDLSIKHLSLNISFSAGTHD